MTQYGLLPPPSHAVQRSTHTHTSDMYTHITHAWPHICSYTRRSSINAVGVYLMYTVSMHTPWHRRARPAHVSLQACLYVPRLITHACACVCVPWHQTARPWRAGCTWGCAAPGPSPRPTPPCPRRPVTDGGHGGNGAALTARSLQRLWWWKGHPRVALEPWCTINMVMCIATRTPGRGHTCRPTFLTEVRPALVGIHVPWSCVQPLTPTGPTWRMVGLPS